MKINKECKDMSLGDFLFFKWFMEHPIVLVVCVVLFILAAICL